MQSRCRDLLTFWLLAIGRVECREIAVDARFNLFHAPLQLGAGEVAVAVVDSLEFAAVNGNQRFREQTKPLTEYDKLSADIGDGTAVIFAEVGDGLEVRRQMSGQPHQFNVTLRFSLQATAGLKSIEIAVDVNLEKNRWMIGRASGLCRRRPFETHLRQIQFIDEDVDYPNGVTVCHVVAQLIGKQDTLTAIPAFNEASHRCTSNKVICSCDLDRCKSFTSD